MYGGELHRYGESETRSPVAAVRLQPENAAFMYIQYAPQLEQFFVEKKLTSPCRNR